MGKAGARTPRFDTTFAAIADSHCPFHCSDSLEFVCDYLSSQKPRVVVHLGDLLELDAGSRFENEYEHDLHDELEAADEYLGRLEEASPGSTLVFCEGNHEWRLRKPGGQIEPKLRRTLDLKRLLPRLGGWRLVPYCFGRDGVYRLGQVSFFHGYKTSANGWKYEAVRLGMPHGLAVGGHTHRPKGVTQVPMNATVDLPYWYANPGTLGPLKPEWMRDKDTSNWGRGLIEGSCNAKRTLYAEPHWEARLRRME